ncbi:MAG: glycine cleavage system aminomethyltransferase GcvT [bacterium]|nr:glycine cleavage system aminomethyltransferase GcvT [bacterium]MCP4968787.1 glycine cleavage system aminomethyltransferase GcvT [bacterium]
MPDTPLRSDHEALGARFTDFGGWEMPLQYKGVIAEHMAVRQSVGVFDVTHLGRFRLTGVGATAAIRKELCNDIDKIKPGRAQYTMALNETGGVVDDIIIWRFAEDEYWVMPNGVNFDELLGRFAAAPGVEAAPVRSDTVLLAVQGPDSAEVLDNAIGIVPGRFRVATGEFADGPMWVSGTGYTGERGAEIAVPNENGSQLLASLLEVGAVPAGLGSRDTLRLEMGYPLWGQDLDEQTSPLEAGLSWVVDWDHEFVGRDALAAQRSAGLSKQLVAFRTADRRPPRHGYPLRSGDSVGEVASGNFSPVLEVGIGMGYVTPPIDNDANLELEVRGNWQAVELVDPPFLDR